MIYTVRSVVAAGAPWSNEHGQFQTYTLTLDGVEKPADLNQKIETPPPVVGVTLDLTLSEDPKFPAKMKAKKVYTPLGAGGGGGNSPETRRSIEMQHAQKTAVAALALAAEHGEYRPPGVADVVGQIKMVAKALYDQCEEAAA